MGDIITKNGKKDLLHVEGKEREDIRNQSLSLLPFLLLNFRGRRRMSRLDKQDNHCRKTDFRGNFVPHWVCKSGWGAPHGEHPVDTWYPDQSKSVKSGMSAKRNKK